MGVAWVGILSRQGTGGSVLMDRRINRNYDGCTDAYSLSQNL